MSSTSAEPLAWDPTHLGPLTLRSPLVAASGTVGGVTEFGTVADLSVYGAATAKSLSWEPWPGQPDPRLAPTPTGMLNAIGIQNPGVEAWIAKVGEQLGSLPVPVWGSIVGHTVEEFALVAKAMNKADVQAIEVNLSCPNVDGGLFALDAGASADVVAAVRASTELPIGAKLSPDASDIVEVATGVHAAGADWVVLTNTARGLVIDPLSGRPGVAAGTGGYSGPGLKPISLRCVRDVAGAMPDLPIVGCGGVSSGGDVIEYVRAGASAVAIGTAHFAEPRVARRILTELERLLSRIGATRLEELRGRIDLW